MNRTPDKPNGFTLLCVEDEPDILDNNRKAFEDEGYTVYTAQTLAQAREVLAHTAPDALILDIMLPDGLGLDLLSELRSAGNRLPVLLLTAWGRPSDIARGLKAGANYYIAKPFDYEVLLAHVETMLRVSAHIPETVVCGRLTLYIASTQVFADGREIMITPKEFALLVILVQYAGRTVSTAAAYDKIYGCPMGDDNRSIKRLVSRLREKISLYGFDIINVRGQGYRLDA